MCASLENGGLGVTKFSSKILAQRIVWLSKLRDIQQNCVEKVIAEEHIGNFDAEYKGYDFLKGDLNFLKIQSNNDFYNELLQAAKNSYLNMKSERKNSKNLTHFCNRRMLDSDCNPYKPIRELTKVGIFRVRDLIFKKGQRNYQMNVS